MMQSTESGARLLGVVNEIELISCNFSTVQIEDRKSLQTTVDSRQTMIEQRPHLLCIFPP